MELERKYVTLSKQKGHAVAPSVAHVRKSVHHRAHKGQAQHDTQHEKSQE